MIGGHRGRGKQQGLKQLVSLGETVRSKGITKPGSRSVGPD